jgi:hypothetical protein
MLHAVLLLSPTGVLSRYADRHAIVDRTLDTSTNLTDAWALSYNLKSSPKTGWRIC